jgi:hypothetical protein
VNAIPVDPPNRRRGGQYFEVVSIGSSQGQADGMPALEQIGRGQDLERQFGHLAWHQRRASLRLKEW